MRKIHDPEEHWTPLILDYLDKKEPRYYVSTRGRFKAYTPISKGNIIRGKLLHGYLIIDITIREKNGKNKKTSYCCHKLVAETYVPNLDKKCKTKVIHLDYDKRNNSPENLEWVTNQEANDHQMRNPKFLNDTTVFTSKLNFKDVTFLKDLLIRNIPRSIIADYFNLSEMQVGRIAKGQSWSEVNPKYPIS